MGRGDHRSKKGKIWRATFGKKRLKNKKKKNKGRHLGAENINPKKAESKKMQQK